MQKSGVQPSSAAAERVFSLLQISFTKRQQSSLEDYDSLSVMMLIELSPFLYDVIFRIFTIVINKVLEHN